MGNHHNTCLQPAQSLVPDNSSTLLKRNSLCSLHNLHSQQLKKRKDYIMKKWKFYSHEKANEKFVEIQQKMNKQDYPSYFLDIQDVSFLKNNNEYNPTFWISAKIQFPSSNLEMEINNRRYLGQSYSEKEIWNFLSLLTEISIKSTFLPHNLSQIYRSSDNKLKVKDPQILTQIKVEKENYDENQIEKHLQNNILKHTLSLCLLEEVAQTSFSHINKINLKYSTALASLLFRICESYISLNQIFQTLNHHKAERNIQIQAANFFKGSLNQKQNSTSQILFKSSNILSDMPNKGQNFIWQNNFSQLGMKFIENSVEEIEQKVDKEEKQQINENKEQRQLSVNNLKQNLNETHMGNEDEKCEKRSIIEAKKEEKKSKVFNQLSKDMISGETSPNTNKTSLKSSVDLEEHYFIKALKGTKKESIIVSQDLPETNRTTMHKTLQMNESHKIPKKCELFNNSQQSLLQSLIDEDDEIENRQRQISPVMDLNQEIQAITKDFYKLEQQFLEREERVSSFLDLYQIQRNSTIIQVAEEQEQSDDEGSEIEKIFLHSLSQAQSKCDHQNENQLKYVQQEYEGGSRYEGYSLHEQRHGFGKLFYEDGGSYEGNWKEGEIDGFGKLFYQSGKLAYEGEWKKGEFDGWGVIVNECPEQINGRFDHKNLSQLGMSWVKYQGNFKNDNKHGKGTLILPNGQKLVGKWKNNNVEGKGELYKVNGEVIQGIWRENMLQQDV